MPADPWLTFLNASLTATRGMFESMARIAEGQTQTAPHESWEWTSHNSIVRELTTMRVRDFSTRQDGPAVIIVAPYALHAATTADFAHGHSVVEALLEAGIGRILLTDWRKASAELRFLSIDSYLADLNVVVDDIGAPVALAGLCQGGLLAAIYAARFPAKISRLVLAGAPIDIAAAPSLLSEMVEHTPPAAVDALLAQGGGLLLSAQIMAMWPTSASAEQDMREALQIAQIPEPLRERFDAWNRDLVDLPGVFYRQTMDWIFRENRFARGTFPALGVEVGVEEVRCPLFLLAGAKDEVVHPQQLLSIARRGTLRQEVVTRLVEGRHLSLFMGRKVLGEIWPEIGLFLHGALDREKRPHHRSARHSRAP